MAIDPLKDIAVLPYSSGTTGLPKGVMLSHQNLTANIRQTMALGMTTEDAIVLDFLPFYHIYGMMVLLNCGLAAGATQIILPRFDPEAALNLIQQHRVTDLYCVPPVVLALVNHAAPGEFDLSSLRFLMSGAAPLPAEVGRQAAEKLALHRDAGLRHDGVEPDHQRQPARVAARRHRRAGRCRHAGEGRQPGDRRGAAAGRDRRAARLRAAGDAGLLEQPGRDGRDASRRTAGCARATSSSADPDGYIRIHDRKKEMIKYKGYQVAPAELESLLMEHPGVRDAAVIPKADDEAGEVPKAFVVPREPGLDLDAVLRVRRREGGAVQEDPLHRGVDAIPKNPSGKILRRQLIEQERATAKQRRTRTG